jgi:hypothetical protein
LSREAEACPRPDVAEHVRAVRVGQGANCSSVGSVVDTLFATAAVAAAVFAAVAGALASEPIRVRRSPSSPPNAPELDTPGPPEDGGP